MIIYILLLVTENIFYYILVSIPNQEYLSDYTCVLLLLLLLILLVIMIIKRIIIKAIKWYQINYVIK